MSQHPTDVFRTSCGATTPLALNVSGPGWAGGERRVFEQPFVLIGRHERSCLRLEDEEVSPRHAYLQQLGEMVFCVDLGSRTGTRWGGEPHPAGWLCPGQEIQIGPFTLSLAMAARAGRRPDDGTADDWDPLQDRVIDPRPLPQVTVEVGNEVLSHLNMNRVLVLVGSSPACRIRLRDDRVSEYHCSLVRTPQGIWLVDLLNGTGTYLHGQPVAWALVKERYRMQVGPYVLRVWYPGRGSDTPLRSLPEVPAGTLVQQADDTSKSGQRPSQDQGGPEPAASEVSARAPVHQAERDQGSERQGEAEVLRQQLADRQCECDRLRDRLSELEVEVSGMAVLKARLEAAEARAGELDSVRGERDRWQAEAQTLQDRLGFDSADREQLVRLTGALHAAQAERDRLKTEQQASPNLAEQSSARVSDLGGALTEAAATDAMALEEARVPRGPEKQALEDRLELERQAHNGAAEAEVPPNGFRYRLLDALLVSLVVVLAFLAASFAVRNGDFWFHLATGRLLEQKQFVFGVDPFAYTTQGVYWAHHAWLFDRLLYALHGWIGGAGLVLVKALLVAALAWLLTRLRRPHGSGWLPAACTALAVLAMSPRLLLQPACVSYVFLGLTFLLLAQPHADGGKAPDGKHYLHLPLLFILWVNLDEWFLLGPILVVLFWVGERLRGQRRMPGWVVPVSLASCLVNPHGYHAFTPPAELSPVTWTSGLRQDARFQQMFASPWQSTMYFQSAAWQNASALAYFALVALGLVSFLLERQALRGWRFLVWLSFGLLAAWQMRAIPFFAIVAGPVTALNLQDFGVGRRRWRPRMPLVGRLALLLGLLGLISLAWPGWLQGYGRSDRHAAWGVQPDASLRRAAEVLHSWRTQGKLREGERVFALDPEVAQYSAWFCPGEKHFFDHRYPLFPRTAREFEVVYQALNGDRTGEEENGAQADWRQILRAHNVGVVVLFDPDMSRLRATKLRLAGDPQNWALLDEDGHALFFGWKQARPSGP